MRDKGTYDKQLLPSLRGARKSTDDYFRKNIEALVKLSIH
jgi:hypothetical protein